jgi:hypothetical protein
VSSGLRTASTASLVRPFSSVWVQIEGSCRRKTSTIGAANGGGDSVLGNVENRTRDAIPAE